MEFVMQGPLFLLLKDIKFTTIINEDCNRIPNCDISVTGTGPYIANFIGKQFDLNFRSVCFMRNVYIQASDSKRKGVLD
jgi:hypothetical protein